MSSGRRDKRSIAKNKRTSSCATGFLRNLGASAKKKRTSSCANDVRIDSKNGKEVDDWVFDIDSDSDNEGDSGG